MQEIPHLITFSRNESMSGSETSSSSTFFILSMASQLKAGARK